MVGKRHHKNGLVLMALEIESRNRYRRPPLSIYRRPIQVYIAALCAGNIAKARSHATKERERHGTLLRDNIFVLIQNRLSLVVR